MKILKILAAAGLAVTVMAGAAMAEMKTVRIGTEGAYPPFNYLDSAGKLQGFDIDIAKALCEKMKVKCTFIAQDWDGIIPALIAKKYDAIVASMSITDERKKKVDFTDKYYNTPGKFVVAKNSGITDVSPAAMKGKTIGAQSSTIHANYLEAKYKDSNIKLYGTQDEANADLVSGRLDAVLADSVVLFEWMKTKDGACCKFVGPDLTDRKFFGDGAGIAVRKGDDELRKAFNKAIAEILADGTYKKINDKYFPFSVY
ncbi:MAG TPA: transporter substrate-binding domain-containing protein [Rhizobiales bacterium]|nr:transporter substrate-binding domain-containing protein [Hyphomicrobiales bacterium]